MTTSLLQPVRDASAAVLCRMNQATHRTLILPLLLFYPTSRCNSRCVSCDWWRSSGEDDLTLEEIERVVDVLPAFGTRLVAFSGGEPLLRADVFAIADRFRRKALALHLLTSGLALERHAVAVGALFERVTLSLDAATAERYADVRGVDALRTIESGVARMREVAPAVPIAARCTLHALNYRELPAIIRKARAMGVESISFLAADLSPDAFARHGRPAGDRLRLDARQAAEFRSVIESVLRSEHDAFASRFVTTSPDRLRSLPAYYAALNGAAAFPPVSCNAPWVSAVLEANGDLRPCFFHPPVGNVRRKPFEAIVHEDLPVFRRGLNIARHATCQRCVCSINVGVRNMPWR